MGAGVTELVDASLASYSTAYERARREAEVKGALDKTRAGMLRQVVKTVGGVRHQFSDGSTFYLVVV